MSICIIYLLSCIYTEYCRYVNRSSNISQNCTVHKCHCQQQVRRCHRLCSYFLSVTTQAPRITARNAVLPFVLFLSCRGNKQSGICIICTLGCSDFHFFSYFWECLTFPPFLGTQDFRKCKKPISL